MSIKGERIGGNTWGKVQESDTFKGLFLPCDVPGHARRAIDQSLKSAANAAVRKFRPQILFGGVALSSPRNSVVLSRALAFSPERSVHRWRHLVRHSKTRGNLRLHRLRIRYGSSSYWVWLANL